MGIIKKLKKKVDAYLDLYDSLRNLHRIATVQEIDRLRALPRYDDPRTLIRSGFKVYSQNDEDGIIHEIFKRIGVTNKTFVEFGCGAGLENNSLALLYEGWNGLWIDANAESVQKISENYSRLIKTKTLQVSASFITKENIDQLIGERIKAGEIDLLSVDMDGNDYHILDGIRCVKPRVIVIEYNAKFPPYIEWCMGYNPAHVWSADDNMGASLKFLETNLARKGYSLVGCNISGINAFFVRTDLAKALFHEPYTAENHYEPPRFYLSPLRNGHKAAYRTLNDAIGGG